MDYFTIPSTCVPRIRRQSDRNKGIVQEIAVGVCQRIAGQSVMQSA